jgi:ketosteroid isomerase-like protein
VAGSCEHDLPIRPPPTHEMMVAVFDFLDRDAHAPDPDHVPPLAVDHVRGGPPTDNVALVTSSLEAICAWDVDTLVRLYHPDIEFMPLTGTRVESGGYRGHDGVREYMSEARDLWDVLEPVGEVFTDTGDHVIVAGRCRVRGRSSGAESNPVCAWVIGVRDGLIVSHRACESYEEALRVAGVEPP